VWTQAVVHLLCKLDVLSSNSCSTPKKRLSLNLITREVLQVLRETMFNKLGNAGVSISNFPANDKILLYFMAE
jgi:hypothetical protein